MGATMAQPADLEQDAARDRDGEVGEHAARFGAAERRRRVDEGGEQAGEVDEEGDVLADSGAVSFSWNVSYG